MSKTLSHVINEIIRQQSTSEGTIANLHGAVIQSPTSERITRESEWIIYSLPFVSNLSPDQIVSRVSAVTLFSPTVVKTTVGRIEFTAPNPGTYLYATLVEIPGQITFFVEITALGRPISV